MQLILETGDPDGIMELPVFWYDNNQLCTPLFGGENKQNKRCGYSAMNVANNGNRIDWHLGAYGCDGFWYKNNRNVYIALTSGTTLNAQACGQSCVVLDSIATFKHSSRGAYTDFGMR